MKNTFHIFYRYCIIGCIFLSFSALAKSGDLKIAMGQINPIVGDIKNNLLQVKAAYEKALAAGADLIVFPEMTLPGYPAMDLIEQADMIPRVNAAMNELKELTKGKKTAILIGHVSELPKDRAGRRLLNSASLIDNGAVSYQYDKMLLPTYNVYDEMRNYTPGKRSKIIKFRGKRLGIAICEDWWRRDPYQGRILYEKDPIDSFIRNPKTGKPRVDLAISLSASHYVQGKDRARTSVHGEQVQRIGAPLIWVNQSGSLDGLNFDGSSFVLDADGKLVGMLDRLREDFGLVTLSGNSDRHEVTNLVSSRGKNGTQLKEIEVVRRAIVQAIQDYWRKSGLKRAWIASSGGKDSALVAVLATQALGPENVSLVAMPSRFSSEGSKRDSIELARRLGVQHMMIPIEEGFNQIQGDVERALGKQIDGVTPENIQARMRMIILTALSNNDPGSAPLGTSNKGEMATGFTTIYGDMAGVMQPIGDLFRTGEIGELSLMEHINREFGEPIPKEILEKAPSPELKAGQLTADYFPPFPILDPFLRDLIEERMGVEDLVSKHNDKMDRAMMEKIVGLVELQEFKRKQAGPIVVVSKKAFGNGRYFPISSRYNRSTLTEVSPGCAEVLSRTANLLELR